MSDEGKSYWFKPNRDYYSSGFYWHSVWLNSTLAFMSQLHCCNTFPRNHKKAKFDFHTLMKVVMTKASSCWRGCDNQVYDLFKVVVTESSRKKERERVSLSWVIDSDLCDSTVRRLKSRTLSFEIDIHTRVFGRLSSPFYFFKIYSQPKENPYYPSSCATYCFLRRNWKLKN